MTRLQHLFDNNAQWAAGMRAKDPQFFERLARQQTPEFLWIGCSDSRVPANEITGLMPGEVFVHRNIANIVNHADMNCLSVMQYAVDVLRVKHIMVVGHYGCGGVGAVIQQRKSGLVDNWLYPIRQILERELAENGPGEAGKLSRQALWDRLCEANVAEQTRSTFETTIVRDAWARGQELAVHGWIYSLQDGLLRDLAVTVSSKAEADALSNGEQFKSQAAL
jgi:carbonic anhydrase